MVWCMVWYWMGHFPSYRDIMTNSASGHGSLGLKKFSSRLTGHCKVVEELIVIGCVSLSR